MTALVAAACAAVVALAWATVAWLQRRAQLRQGARLDRATPAVYAIDSSGHAYPAVAVEACDRCGQTLPTDHRTRGLCTGAAR